MVQIGDKIYKNDKVAMKNYADVANACNTNQWLIVDKGEYYEITAMPAPTLDELRADKLAEIDAWTAAKITGGFVSNASGEAVTYDSDKDTQLTMQGIALNVNTELFVEKYPTGCPVRGYAQGAEEKTIYMLSAEQVMNWCADLSMHIGTCKQAGWAKQAEVQAATTKEELDAISLE